MVESMDWLQLLSEQGNIEALQAEVSLMAETEITATDTVGNTNTLWPFIDER